MSNAPDIAAHTQLFNDVCPRIHAAVTEPSRKVDAAQGRHRRAAAKGRITARFIRDLLATVGVAVGTDTIARFPAEKNGEAQPQRTSKRPSRARYVGGKAAHARSAAVPASAVATAGTSTSPQSQSSRPRTARIPRHCPNGHAVALRVSPLRATYKDHRLQQRCTSCAANPMKMPSPRDRINRSKLSMAIK